MYYRVKLSIGDTYYQKIKSFKEWEQDSDYFIFFFEGDDTYIALKKEHIISIEKY
jgi:hypothetical protein